MTQVPKNAVVELFFLSSVICFLTQSVSVTELRAVSPRQRPLSYDNLIAPIRDSPDSPTGPTLKVAEGVRKNTAAFLQPGSNLAEGDPGKEDWPPKF